MASYNLAVTRLLDAVDFAQSRRYDHASRGRKTRRAPARTNGAGVRLSVLTLLLAAAPASAQERPVDLPELTLAPCPDAAAVTVQGSTMTASPAWQACVLSRLRGLSLLLPYVHLMETRLRLVDERDELHARELALADRDAELAGEQASVAGAALEAALRRARDAEAERDAWWRSPILWLAVGVVLTVALEIAAVAALGAVAP